MSDLSRVIQGLAAGIGFIGEPSEPPRLRIRDENLEPSAAVAVGEILHAHDSRARPACGCPQYSAWAIHHSSEFAADHFLFYHASG
jgi:hypothetical protein